MLRAIARPSEISAPLCFWLVTATTLLVGLFVQFFAPSVFPGGYLGHGLFVGDAASYHEGADLIAGKLEIGGWRIANFDSVPSFYTWLIAVLYHATGVREPWVTLPFNALVQGWIAWQMFRAGKVLGFSLPASAAGAFWVGLNPQTLEWSAQLGKEGLFLAGNLLIISSLISSSLRAALLQAFGGTLLVFLMRPGWGELLFYQGMVLFLILVVPVRFEKTVHVAAALTVALTGFACKNLPVLLPERSAWIFSPRKMVSQEERERASDLELARWQTYSVLKNTPLDLAGLRIFLQRRTYLLIGGRSIVDGDVFLETLGQQTLYLPRALQISLLAPFPWASWEKRPKEGDLSVPAAGTKDYSGQETIRAMIPWLKIMVCFSYILLGSLFFYVTQLRGKKLLPWCGVISFCLLNLTFLGMVCPNLGTLVRIRFAYWGILTALGTMAAANVISSLYQSLSFSRSSKADGEASR